MLKAKAAYKPKFGTVEIVFGCAIAFYIVCFFIGMQINKSKAKNWFAYFKPLLSKQFAVIGKSSTIAQNNPEDNVPEVATESIKSAIFPEIDSMELESFSRYILAVTGRKNCLGARFAIDLKHRQDLLSLVMGLFTGAQDTLTIDIFLSTPSQSVLYVCPQKLEKKARESVEDLNNFTSKVNMNNLDDLCILAECPEETLYYYFTEQVIKILEQNSDLILEMHVTDQKAIFTTHNQIMRCIFKLPSSQEDLKRLSDLILVALFWLDTSVTMKQSMNKLSLDHFNKNRAKLNLKEQKSLHQARQEAAQKRKEEKLQKEFESLKSAEARQKFEEKLKKKEMKARIKKIR